MTWGACMSCFTVIAAATVAISEHARPVSEHERADLPRITGVSDGFFVDDKRRVRLFHGFNDVGEETKRVGPFDGYNYLPQNLISNASRLEILANEYGFNCFRIGAIWAALQPEPNVTDQRYLTALQNATRMLASHGVYSLLDMHQDALSTYDGWAGHDGAPTWVVNRTKPRHPFPWPYHDPKGDATEAVAQAFQEIYKDTHGGRQAWAAAWQTFASTFRGEPGVVGYELMNEPFAGDVYADPLLWDPAHAGAQNLQPAYDIVAKAIREVDEDTVIFYEPVTWGMIFDTRKFASLGSGFSHVPGGQQYANRSAYSYHYYCWLGRTHENGSPAPNMPYPALKKEECQGKLGLGPKTFASVQETIKTLGGGSFLTEWGGIYFTPPFNSPQNSTAMEETMWVLEEADAQLQSWTHWDIDYFLAPGPDAGGFVGCEESYPRGCIKDFIRPYAQAVAGVPVAMKYDRESHVFTLSMQPDGTIQAPTEIFIPAYCYSTGYSVILEPATAPFTWTSCPGYVNKLCLVSKPGALLPALLTVTVSPKHPHHQPPTRGTLRDHL